MSFETFLYAILGWTVLAVVIIPVMLKIAAPYGRHTTETWGPMISNQIGWIIMESPSMLLVTYFYWTGDAPKNLVTHIIYALFMIHYIHRDLIFPFRLRTKGKKMPVAIMSSAIFFNLVNGSMIGYFLGHFAEYPMDWLQDIRFLAGVAIFILGFAINFWADTVLINLRKPGETGYKIPFGGLFNYISCPNHFGETIEWAGFALLTWSVPGLSFFIWTAANLIPRSLKHHEWYKSKFPDYPKERKAVIPTIL